MTGSSGTIGKPLVELLKKKHIVKEFDLAQGHDLLNFDDIFKAVKGMDVVIHTAAVLNENAPRLMEVNIIGTENVLSACKQAKVKRVIYLSSVAVYGKNQENATEETKFEPVTLYEKSKAEAEKLAKLYFGEFDLTILRPAIVLGPNVYWEKIFKLIKKPVPFFGYFPLIGNGSNYWQIIHRDDVISAIMFCLENKKTIGQTYNIAEANAHTLKEIVMNARLMMGISPRVKTVPKWVGFIGAGILNASSIIVGKKGIAGIVTPAYVERLIRSRKYSIEKIKKEGWTPQYEMKQALEHTFEAFKTKKIKI